MGDSPERKIDEPKLVNDKVAQRRHLLVDLENRQPTAEQIAEWVGPDDAVWVFHGPHQKKLLPKLKALGPRIEIIEITKTGDNALDFHLTFHLGYLAAKHENCRFFVLSGDGGFDATVKYARFLNFEVVRIETLSGDPATVRSTSKAPAQKKANVAKKTATPKKKAKATKAVAASAAPAKATVKKSNAGPAKNVVPAKKSAPTKKATPAKKVPTKKVPANLLTKVIANLRDHPLNRPGSLNGMHRHIRTLSANKAPVDEVTTIIAALEKSGMINVTANKVAYLPSGKNRLQPITGAVSNDL